LACELPAGLIAFGSVARRDVQLSGLELGATVGDGALAGCFDLGFGCLAPHPGGALDRLARLEVLVHLEEVLDLEPVELGEVA